ncbi:hypothetical protein L204_105506 [Cryptococcus depauperatus]|nr:hypothetical protein L204_02725 [Cryptococcus depauperatus CBS 7855]
MDRFTRSSRRRSSNPSKHMQQRGESEDTRRSSFVSTTVSGSLDFEGLSDWEKESDDWENNEMATDRKRKEPMSPVAVILYMVGFYLAFQILTRSDEMEILAPASSISQTYPPSMNIDASQYHLPYHMAPVPKLMPEEASSTTSYWHVLFGYVMFSVYFIITLLTIPVPLLFNTAYIIRQVLSVIFSPFTASLWLLLRLFVLRPMRIVKNVLDTFYPAIMFVGCILGVGIFMGAAAGWVGNTLLRWYTGWKRKEPKSSRSRRPKSSSRALSKKSSNELPHYKRRCSKTSLARQKISTPLNRVTEYSCSPDDYVVCDTTTLFENRLNKSKDGRDFEGRSTARQSPVGKIRTRANKDDSK